MAFPFPQQIDPQAGIKHKSGTSSPEGSVTGYVGSHYFDTSNGDLYYKASGDNTNTGWTWINSIGGGGGGTFSTGTLVMSIANSISGALKFDNVSSYSKATYSSLYSLI